MILSEGKTIAHLSLRIEICWINMMKTIYVRLL